MGRRWKSPPESVRMLLARRCREIASSVREQGREDAARLDALGDYIAEAPHEGALAQLDALPPLEGAPSRRFLSDASVELILEYAHGNFEIGLDALLDLVAKIEAGQAVDAELPTLLENEE